MGGRSHLTSIGRGVAFSARISQCRDVDTDHRIASPGRHGAARKGGQFYFVLDAVAQSLAPSKI